MNLMILMVTMIVIFIRCLDILEQQKSDSKQKATTDYTTDVVMQNSKRRRVDSEGIK